MTIGEIIAANDVDMVEVVCKDYRQCNLAPLSFIHEKYDGTDVMNTEPKSAVLSRHDGKTTLTFTL